MLDEIEQCNPKLLEILLSFTKMSLYSEKHRNSRVDKIKIENKLSFYP